MTDELDFDAAGRAHYGDEAWEQMGREREALYAEEAAEGLRDGDDECRCCCCTGKC